MLPGQFPGPPRRRSISPVTVLLLVLASAGALICLVPLVSIGLGVFRAYRFFSSHGMGQLTGRGRSRSYRTLAESLPDSHRAAGDLSAMSHKAVMTVNENKLYNDREGHFKGYLEFGYVYKLLEDPIIHSSESGSLSTLVAPNHLYFADFKRLKLGQRIFFEEIPTNNLPTEKNAFYSADPYLFVRPVAVR